MGDTGVKDLYFSIYINFCTESNQPPELNEDTGVKDLYFSIYINYL